LKYRADGEPLKIGNCYCIDCQRETGAGHSCWLVYPAPAVTTEGEIKTYTKNGDSGQRITRTFCPNCGTTIFGEPTVVGEVRVIRAGTLDDTSGLVPTISFFVRSACAWDQPPDDIPQLSTMAD
jgi:hypothetical protein